MATKRDALEAEATGESKVTFTFKGMKLTVPIGRDMTRATLKAYEQNLLATFCELAVGHEQFLALEKANAIDKVGDLQDLAEAIFIAGGSSKGE